MNQNSNKYDKLGAAMCSLENVFYEDMDPSGETGYVTLIKMEQYLTVCGEQGNSFHDMMTSWFNRSLNDK